MQVTLRQSPQCFDSHRPTNATYFMVVLMLFREVKEFHSLSILLKSRSSRLYFEWESCLPCFLVCLLYRKCLSYKKVNRAMRTNKLFQNPSFIDQLLLYFSLTVNYVKLFFVRSIDRPSLPKGRATRNKTSNEHGLINENPNLSLAGYNVHRFLLLIYQSLPQQSHLSEHHFPFSCGLHFL